MSVLKWPNHAGEPTRAALEQKLRTMGYTVQEYTYAPGTYFPPHDHAVDKIDAVVQGRFLIEMNQERFDLGPGDMVEVPAGTTHSAKVLGDEPVVSLDAIRRKE